MSVICRSLAVVLAVLLFSAPSSAQETCQQADIAGSWDLYLAGGEVDGAWGGWSACRINLSNQGAPRGSCVDEDNEVVLVVGGQLNVRPTCRIAGRLVVEADGIRIPVRIARATLAPSGELVAGVATTRADDFLFSVLLQMVRN